MNILSIDSSKKRAYVIVSANNVTTSITLGESEKHSENLLVRIDEALQKANVELKDIDVFSAVVGPGSFTGIRVGLSTIKAFNMVHNKKLVSVNAFEPFLEIAKEGVILLGSTKTTFYFATVKNSNIVEMGTVNVQNLDNLLLNKKVYMLDYERYEELRKYDILFVDNYSELLNNLVVKKCESGNFINDNEFEPLYLQLSQAEVELNNKK